MVIWRKLERFENSASDHLCPRQSFSTPLKTTGFFSVTFIGTLCMTVLWTNKFVSKHTSRSSRILLLCQAPGSRSHCNCRLFSPPAPRVAFKREKSFFVPEIPQIIFPFFPLVTLCRRAKLADWLRLGGFCESERLISSAICWAENFFGTRELRKPEPATLLNSWFAGFPLDLLVLPHTNHIQYKIYWEKHKCKELENIQSWVIQLAPAFPRPPSSPTRAEHYCRAGFWFDCI